MNADSQTIDQAPNVTEARKAVQAFTRHLRADCPRIALGAGTGSAGATELS
jgi:hypothetical protein